MLMVTLQNWPVLVMGFANMLADGISMGLGDYLSSSAELKFAKMERARELWECDNDLDAEKAVRRFWCSLRAAAHATHTGNGRALLVERRH